jgi:hypothetical protein
VELQALFRQAANLVQVAEQGYARFEALGVADPVLAGLVDVVHGRPL